MTSKTLLIVDDSPISRRILKSCLPRDRAFTLVEADDGDTGLAAHREHRPDITFLDLTMPRMHGLDCLTGIRSSSPEAVVIIVTADVQMQALRRALDLGALEILRKPPSKETVAAVLTRAESRLGATVGTRA